MFYKKLLDTIVSALITGLLSTAAIVSLKDYPCYLIIALILFIGGDVAFIIYRWLK
jgi:hypothetical protein